MPKSSILQLSSSVIIDQNTHTFYGSVFDVDWYLAGKCKFASDTVTVE